MQPSVHVRRQCNGKGLWYPGLPVTVASFGGGGQSCSLVDSKDHPLIWCYLFVVSIFFVFEYRERKNGYLRIFNVLCNSDSFSNLVRGNVEPVFKDCHLTRFIYCILSSWRLDGSWSNPRWRLLKQRHPYIHCKGINYLSLWQFCAGV